MQLAVFDYTSFFFSYSLGLNYAFHLKPNLSLLNGMVSTVSVIKNEQMHT